jgi:hypothetical protein
VIKDIANMLGDLPDVVPARMDYYFMWRYRGAADFADTAKFVREEGIDVNGRRVSCYVVALPTRDTTWWVKVQFRILREESEQGSAVFTAIHLGDPIPDERFKFVPPPGAKKIAP